MKEPIWPIPAKEIRWQDATSEEAEEEDKEDALWARLRLLTRLSQPAPRGRVGRSLTAEASRRANRELPPLPLRSFLWERKGVGMKPKTSWSERRMKQLLDVFFPAELKKDNRRYDWLKNPLTGQPLELDRYYPGLKLAFEFQGDQHYRFAPKLQKRRRDFQAQLHRDETKRILCIEHGVRLIYVRHSDLDLPSLGKMVGLSRQRISQSYIGQAPPLPSVLASMLPEDRECWKRQIILGAEKADRKIKGRKARHGKRSAEFGKLQADYIDYMRRSAEVSDGIGAPPKRIVLGVHR